MWHCSGKSAGTERRKPREEEATTLVPFFCSMLVVTDR